MKQRANLDPAEQFFVALLALALRDARNQRSPERQNEAISFLWLFAEDIAQRAGLPKIEDECGIMQECSHPTVEPG